MSKVTELRKYLIKEIDQAPNPDRRGFFLDCLRALDPPDSHPSDEEWDESLDDYRAVWGTPALADVGEWHRMFWEAGYRRGVTKVRKFYD